VWLKPLALVLVFVLAQLIAAGHSAFAASSVVNVRKSQAHLRTGIIDGKYKGTFEGSFQVSSAIDFDYEFFVSNASSVIFRFLQGLDSASVPFYTYAGSGMRYYFKSKGTMTDQREPGLFITSKPKIRTYVGGDLGIAQVIVKSFGPNVQSVANMLDFGANVGAIYQLTDNLGLELHTGATVAYGMSSTPQNGYSQRYLFGISYFF